MSGLDMNTIFEQDGKVYAICSHKVPPKDLAKFISTELKYMHKIPRAQMRIVPTEEFRKMSFGSPITDKPDKPNKSIGQKPLPLRK